MNLIVATLIRAAMIAIGTWAGNDGWKEESTIQAVVGGIVALGGLVWGLLEKQKLKSVGIKKLSDADRRVQEDLLRSPERRNT